jgi:hypothetical protein
MDYFWFAGAVINNGFYGCILGNLYFVPVTGSGMTFLFLA